MTTRLQHRWVGAVATLALLGCSTESFNQLNDQLRQSRNSLKNSVGATLPAGAVATNLALMRLFNALSKETTGKTALQGAQWAPVRGPQYRVADNAGLTTHYDLNDANGTGSLTAADNGKPLVSVTFRFSRTPSTIAPDQLGQVKAHYELTDLKGTVAGFGVDWEGTFDYEPLGNPSAMHLAQAEATVAPAVPPATIAMWVKGKLMTPTDVLDLHQLSFETQIPTPSTVPQIGVMQMTRQSDGDGRILMEGVIGIQNDQATVNGTSSMLRAGRPPEVLQQFSLDRDGKLVTR